MSRLTDEFHLSRDGHYVFCESKSGKTYRINHLGCNCKGYEMRGDCRQYRQAQNSGMLESLKVEVDESVHNNFCTECGSSFNSGDKFCGHCGKKRA